MSFIETVGNIQAPAPIKELKNSTTTFLRQHRQIHKLALLVDHAARAGMTYAMMAMIPGTAAAKMTLTFGASAYYWLTAERCPFQFSIPAFVGAVTYGFSKPALPALVNGAAFRSLAAFVTALTGTWPFLLYAFVVTCIVHTDVERWSR
jgi:hypothetical protein